MSPLTAAALALGVLAVATVLGLAYQRRGARVRSAPKSAAGIDLAELGVAANPGAWTVIQFTTAWCSRCPAVRASIQRSLTGHPDVSFAEIDLTDRTDLATKHSILSTPTIFLVAPGGSLVSRLTGGVTGAAVLAEIASRSSDGADHAAQTSHLQ